MRFQPKCELIAESIRFDEVELLNIHYDMGSITGDSTLTLQLESSTEGKFQIVFDSPEAVRVIDEGQICEFWNKYSTPNGWLWQVLEGGWIDLELQRSTFWGAEPPSPPLEFLIVGDQCVFVMAQMPPRFISRGNTTGGGTEKH